jgi:hypothetical protein
MRLQIIPKREYEDSDSMTRYTVTMKTLCNNNTRDEATSIQEKRIKYYTRIMQLQIILKRERDRSRFADCRYNVTIGPFAQNTGDFWNFSKSMIVVDI